MTFNFANTYKELYIKPDAISELDIFLSEQFSNRNRTIFNACVNTYRCLIASLNELAGGNYSSIVNIGNNIWKKNFDYGYYTFCILTDSSYRRLIFVVEDFFFTTLSVRTRTITESQLRSIIRESIKKVLRIS